MTEQTNKERRRTNRRRTSFAKWGSIVFVCLLIISGLGLGGYLYQNQNFQNELRDTLVENCITNGNPGREAEVEDLQEGIEDLEETITSPSDPRIPKLFPDVPQAYAEELIIESNQKAHNKIARKEARMKTLTPVDCEAKYPTR